MSWWMDANCGYGGQSRSRITAWKTSSRKWTGSARRTGRNWSIGDQTWELRSSMTATAEDASVLQAGDLVWVDLRPTRGREQRGVRPAVVLTNREFHRRNDTAIVCPITSNRTPWPTKVILPDGLAARGAILVDQVRTLDRSARGFRSLGRVPDRVLDEVRGRLAALLGIDILAIARGAEGM